jgi:hypothetical protein
MSKLTGGLYLFRSGFRIIVGEPEMHEGQLNVPVAQPYIRLTSPLSVRVNEDGTPFAYPGVAYLPVSLLSHKAVLNGSAQQDSFGSFDTFNLVTIKEVPKRNKKRRKPRPKKKPTHATS